MRKCTFFGILAIMFMTMDPVLAASFKWEFSGHAVIADDPDSGWHLFDAPIPVHGVIRAHTEASAASVSDSCCSADDSLLAIGGFSLDFYMGSLSFHSDDGWLEFDGNWGAAYLLFDGTPFGSFGILDLFVGGSPGLDAEADPLAWLLGSDWSSAGATFGFSPLDSVSFLGELTAANGPWAVVSTPEPAPLALMLLGLAGFQFARRAKSA